MRYPTQPCEGVCALNHYCAITRVDYNEFRRCLETAASALASHGVRTCSPCIAIVSTVHVALILAIYAVAKYRHQCELLIEWLYIRHCVDGLVNIVLVKYVITFLVDLMHKLRFKRFERIVASSPSSPLALAMTATTGTAAATTTATAMASSTMTTTTCTTLRSVPAEDNSFNQSSIYRKSTELVHEKCNEEEVVRLKIPLEPKSNPTQRSTQRRWRLWQWQRQRPDDRSNGNGNDDDVRNGDF